MKLKLAAIGELVARHNRVFGHAWRERKSLDPVGRTRGEAEFLPAALALVETPLSPAPRVAMWLLMGLAVIALTWAIFGRIDIVATAQGKIVPNDRTKLIQPLETAKVVAIHVHDGQQVKVGDVLIELDPTAAHADQRRLQVEQVNATLQAGRARAMMDALTGNTQPTLEHPAGIPESEYAEALQLLEGHFAEYASRRARLQADLRRREAERQSTLELVRKLEQTVPLAQQPLAYLEG